MICVRPLLLLAVCVLPGSAVAQTWADAVQAGDYKKAADLLHPIVIDQALKLEPVDPGAMRQLASLYARGLGVPQDSIAACALASNAKSLSYMAPPVPDQSNFAYQGRLDESDKFAEQMCGVLTPADRLSAGRSMGCFAFGMPEASLPLGSRTVLVGRSGIRLAETLDADGLMHCPQLVARARVLTVSPPPDAAPGIKSRDFVELLAWYVGHDPAASALVYFLQWQMYERRGEKLDIVAMEDVGLSRSWPTPALPPDFDTHFTIEMIRSGHVRWRLEGAPPKRGWIMLPEEKTR